MNSKLIECWSMCIRCNYADTETPRRNHRVSPASPISVISVRPKTAQEYNNEDKDSVCESSYSGEINPQFNLHEDGVESSPFGVDSTDGSSSFGDRSNTQKKFQVPDNQIVTTVFIETGKEKRLRVVHYKAADISIKKKKFPPAVKLNSSFPFQSDHEGSGSIEVGTNENENENSGEEDENDEEKKSGKDSDDEEEYWFTKWSRKPRFNSIFAKSTIHAEDRRSSGESVTDRNLEALQEADRIADGVIIEENGEVIQDAMDSIRWSKECSVINMDNQNSSKVQNGDLTQQVIGYTNLGFEQEEQDSKYNCEKENLNQYNTEERSRDEQVDEYRTALSPLRVPPVSFVLGNSAMDPGMDDSNLCVSSSMIELELLRDKSETLEVSGFKQSSDIVNSNSSVNTYIPSTPKLPVLFFIHGISGSSEIWKTQIDFFHKLGYEMIVPDLLGHGLSSTPSQPKHYLLESLVQDLICVFDYFIREDTKTVIIGHGYGASLGTLLSRTRPKNVALLILIGGGGPTPMVRPTCCQNSALPLYCRLFHGKKRRGRFDNPELRHVLPSIVHQNVIAGQIWEDGDSAFHRRITIPTLLVYGMRDKVVNLVEECEMERTIPRAFLELITTAGHMVMWDEPQKLNKMLAKFIQSWA